MTASTDDKSMDWIFMIMSSKHSIEYDMKCSEKNATISWWIKQELRNHMFTIHRYFKFHIRSFLLHISHFYESKCENNCHHMILSFEAWNPDSPGDRFVSLTFLRSNWWRVTGWWSWRCMQTVFNQNPCWRKTISIIDDVS